VKYLLLGAAAVALSACNTTGGLMERASALSQANPHCKKDITVTAQVGPMNPASGAYISYRVYDCIQTAPQAVNVAADPVGALLPGAPVATAAEPAEQ